MLRPHPKYPHLNVGRKGPVIYYAWHDIACVRSYTKPKNPRTPSQQANRNLHGRLTALSGKTKDFRRFCFDGIPSYRSSHTAFIGIQMCQLRHTQTSTNLPLEAQLCWGHGSLPGTSQISFSWKERPLLKWECDKRKLTRKTDPNNKALWIVWNANRDAWQWSLQGGKRSNKKALLDLPEDWKKEELYIWLLFYDATKKRFSCDTCLHVKAGKEHASCSFQEHTLYTSQRIPFDILISYWIIYRPLRSRERQRFREKYYFPKICNSATPACFSPAAPERLINLK